MTHSSVAVLGGTPTHIPPEKWKNYEMEPDVKLDVYSFGIMLWELCANEKPFARCGSGTLSFIMIYSRMLKYYKVRAFFICDVSLYPCRSACP